jgi:coenzyme PQQ precursor peptide PqqA
MEWTAPKFEEVALNCEINSYASAAVELQLSPLQVFSRRNLQR